VLAAREEPPELDFDGAAELAGVAVLVVPAAGEA
jgi:hypothetical protein